MIPKKVAIFDDRELMAKPLFPPDEPKSKQLKKETFHSPYQPIGPKPLSFDNVPVAKPKLSEAKPLFGDTTTSAEATAIEHARQTFPTIGKHLANVERQIKTLMPLNLSTVMNWGSTGLESMAALSSTISQSTNAFSSLRCNELMDKVLQSITQVQKPGLLARVFGNDDSEPISALKPKLIASRSQLKYLLPQYDQYVTDLDKADLRLTINLAALASACEIAGNSPDDAMNTAISERRSVLAQAINQTKLLALQLAQSRKMIVEQIARSDQLLNVTIPAYEATNPQPPFTRRAAK